MKGVRSTLPALHATVNAALPANVRGKIRNAINAQAMAGLPALLAVDLEL